MLNSAQRFLANAPGVAVWHQLHVPTIGARPHLHSGTSRDVLKSNSHSEAHRLAVLARIGAGHVSAFDPGDELRTSESEACIRRLDAESMAHAGERLPGCRIECTLDSDAQT